MRLRCCLVFVAVTTTTLAIEPPLAMDAKAVQARLKGDWREFDVRVPREKQLYESFGFQWTMYQPADPTSPPNQAWWTDHDNESVQQDGVLLLNVAANPIWLDFCFKDDSGEYLQVGILRFEGEHPRWVLNKEWVRRDTWERAKGKVPERPTAFEGAQKRPSGYRLEPFTFGTR